MAAVADPPVDSIIAQPTRFVQFAAYRAELKLVHTATYDILGAQGQKTGQQTGGVRIGFVDGMLKVPLDGKVYTEQGREFDGAELIEWLRSHRLNGNRDEGFWEVPNAAPAVSGAETEAIMEASALANLPRLRELLEAEQRGWNRGELTRPIQKSIDTIETLLAESRAQEEQREAEETRQPPAKKPAPRAKG